MNDDPRAIDKGWDGLPEYGKPGDADDAVTVSISTTPGEWLVNTIDAVVVPMSMAELVEALRAHKLTLRSLVWRAGMQEWAPVDAVPQLKLAARMPSAAAQSTVAAGPTAASGAPSKPPPKPTRSSTSASPALGAQAFQSRRSTLPFGLQAPLTGQSRPAGARPSSPRNAAPAAPRHEEPAVLAVYDRPAATVSFELSPPESPPASAPRESQPPETLAPLTTDSARRRLSPPRSADLSVVAASEFRQVQRSSKRLVWMSSLASAAAASLLTLWLAHEPSTGHPGASTTGPAESLVTAVPTPPAPAASPAPPSAPSAVATANAAPSAVAPARTPAPAVRPKPIHKPRAAVVAPRPAPDADTAHTSDPSSEPNPYDGKLDDAATRPAPATSHTAPPEPEKDVKDPDPAPSATGSPDL